MKIVLYVLFAMTFQCAIGQSLFFTEKENQIRDIALTIDSTKDTRAVVYLTFVSKGTSISNETIITDENKDVTAKVSLLKVGVDTLSKFIEFTDFEHTFKKSETVGIPIIIRKGIGYNSIKNKVLMLGLESTSPGVIKDDAFILQIKLEKKQDKEFDSKDFQFTVLTGGNLSFFEKPKISNFAGIVNAYMPNVIGILGLSVGISNLNFIVDDPGFSNAVYSPRNILIDPKAGAINGAAYERITYKRYRSEAISSWSYYLQPTFQMSSGENYNLSLLVHAELLSQTSVSTITEKNVQIDTLVVSLPRDQTLTFDNNRSPQQDRTITLPFANGYFGAGILWNVRQKDKFNFILNCAFGPTTDNFKARQQHFFNAISEPRRNPVVVDTSTKWFYYVRAMLTEKVTKLNATIGVDLRGNGNFTPQVGAYLGFKFEFNKP